jgi:hypothetical protein
LHPRFESPFPKHPNTKNNQQPFKRGEEGPEEPGIIIGNGGKISEPRKGNPVGVGEGRVDGEVLQIMKKHSQEKINCPFPFEEPEKEDAHQGQRDGVGPIHAIAPVGPVIDAVEKVVMDEKLKDGYGEKVKEHRKIGDHRPKNDRPSAAGAALASQ